MLDLIEYICDKDSIIICRCYGDGGRIQLPESIDKIPVAQIADHCFAGSPSVSLKDKPRHFASLDLSGTLWETIPDEAPERLPEPVSAEKLEEVFLPEGLTGIGDYAFYGCRRLKIIHFPASLKNIGRGAFVAAGKIRELWFELTRDGEFQDDELKRIELSGSLMRSPEIMRTVLGDINYGVRTVFTRSGKTAGALYFPGYYEESIENTPARIIEVKYRGTGYKYRQCFRDGMLDLRQYDSLLYETSNWEDEEAVARLCLDRISWPLDSETRELYISCLRENCRGAADIIFKEQQTDLLKLLCEESFFTPKLLELFTDQAAKSQDAQAAAMLIDYGKKHFPGKKRRFVL